MRTKKICMLFSSSWIFTLSWMIFVLLSAVNTLIVKAYLELVNIYKSQAQNMATDLETPFSPCSFEFQPGSPDPSSQNTRIKQSFRFAGAPDGPLPSIPSGEEDDSEDSNEPEIVFRRKLISRPVEKPIKKSLNWKDFPFLSALACFLCVLGGIEIRKWSAGLRNPAVAPYGVRSCCHVAPPSNWALPSESVIRQEVLCTDVVLWRI